MTSIARHRPLHTFALAIAAFASLTYVALPPRATPAVAATTTSTASSLLKKLSVRAEITSPAYDRALFPHWIDVDNDCQNTRAEVLIVESLTTVSFTTASSCTVSTGQWYSWFDGATWTNASDVDIDHVIALKEAWDSGAASWSTSRRQAFANDVGVSYALEAVTDNVNQSKSDQDPATWLPPLPAARCQYATNWVLLKWRWRLSIDVAEKNALAGILNGTCGNATVILPTRP